MKEILDRYNINTILDNIYLIGIVLLLIGLLYIVWRLVDVGTHDYAMNRYNYKVKIIVRDEALFIYFKPFWIHPDLINYKRIREIGVNMAKHKAPKAYKNMIKYIYTVNMRDLMIYKEHSLDKQTANG